MMKVEFKVGMKFIYLGSYFPKEYGRTQEVLQILTINGEPSVRSKFIDNDLVHIFEIRNRESSYSNFCYPIDMTYDNGVPMFWEHNI